MAKGFVEELDMCPLKFRRTYIHENKCLSAWLPNPSQQNESGPWFNMLWMKKMDVGGPHCISLWLSGDTERMLVSFVAQHRG